MKTYLRQKTILSAIAGLAVTGISLLSHGGQSTAAFVESDLDPVVEKRIDKMISSMTLEEKLGQMSLRDWLFYKDSDFDLVREEIRQGKIGGFLNVPRSSHDPKAFSKLQKLLLKRV